MNKPPRNMVIGIAVFNIPKSPYSNWFRR